VIPIADLVRVLHDIDAMKGQTCATCLFPWWRCRMHPAGPTDGCYGWVPSERYERKAHRRPRDEAGVDAASKSARDM
jgi:hypothetical protein